MNATWVSDLCAPSSQRWTAAGQQTKVKERGKRVPRGGVKDKENGGGGGDCTGDSEVSTVTSAVFSDITEHTRSSAA